MAGHTRNDLRQFKAGAFVDRRMTFDYALTMFWQSLATPCALVDLDRVEANSARMAARAEQMGVRLRPHVKTHKSVEAARFQTRGHFGGVTVSTLAEAEAFAAAGFRDITYAVPIGPDRLEDALRIASADGVDALNLLVDQRSSVEAISEFASRNATTLSVFIKVDCGYHRAGVDPASTEAVEIARIADASQFIDLRGILTHAGHSYDCHNQEEILVVAEQERRTMVDFAEKLRGLGIAVEEVSVGSTPTMSLVGDLSGVSEARPGNYVFYDAFQASIGSCALSDVAFSVLVTVLGHYPERNEVLINAGALAFSKDPGPRHVNPGCGYGAVFSADGRVHQSELTVRSLSQEHGKLKGAEPIDYSLFPVGSRLRVVPNHSCLSAALFERYNVYRADKVVDEWTPVRGW